ncbi:MAG: hypothetical protein WA857_06390 [Candidatus Acidiferrum sp.]
MKAWLREQLITIEGTHEEWAEFLERLFWAYKYYPGDRMRRDLLLDVLKEYPPKEEKPPARNWTPDLEWYDKH